MGAYSPAPVVTPAVYERAMNEIILPTVRGMKADGNEFTGFLYAGLMIDASGAPYTIEFNCRFGDPETQPIMSRLDSDFVELIQAALNRQLDSVTAQWKPQTAVGVVLAAENYPDSPKKAMPSAAWRKRIKSAKYSMPAQPKAITAKSLPTAAAYSA